MRTVLAGGVLLFSVLVSLLSAFPETNCVVPQGRPRVQVQRVGAFSVWILFTLLFRCGGFLATVFHRPSNRWWSWLLIVETAWNSSRCCGVAWPKRSAGVTWQRPYYVPQDDELGSLETFEDCESDIILPYLSIYNV